MRKELTETLKKQRQIAKFAESHGGKELIELLEEMHAGNYKTLLSSSKQETVDRLRYQNQTLVMVISILKHASRKKSETENELKDLARKITD